MEQQQVNLQEMSLTELKSLAYDLIVQQANIQQSIQVVQQEIQKRESSST